MCITFRIYCGVEYMPPQGYGLPYKVRQIRAYNMNRPVCVLSDTAIAHNEMCVYHGALAITLATSSTDRMLVLYKIRLHISGSSQTVYTT